MLQIKAGGLQWSLQALPAQTYMQIFLQNCLPCALTLQAEPESNLQEMTVPETCSILSTQILPLSFAEFL